jgi:DnaJ domain
MDFSLLLFLCLISLFPKVTLCETEEESSTKRKKRNDQRTVNAVLKSRDRNNLYGILGLPNNRYLCLPGRSLTIIPNYLSIQIPELTFFRVSKNQIKRAFRERALSVHPDKTADPRASEAFNAIDEAAETLLDDGAREKYDLSITLARQKHRSLIIANLRTGMDRVWGLIHTCLKRVWRLLGPFAVPVVVVAFLIF